MSLNISKLELLKQLEFDNIENLDKKQIKKLIKESKLQEYLEDIFSKVEDKVVDIEEIKKLELDNNLSKIVYVYLDIKGYTIFDENKLEEIDEDDNMYQEVLPEANYEVMSSDIVRDYMLEITKYPLLTPEEEKELFIRYNNGEIKLKEKIFLSNLRLGVHVAKRYILSGIPFMDLIQESNVGLLKAIDRFDVTKGFKFSTYATWWIRQAVKRYCDDAGRIIRIPVHQNEKIEKVRRIKNKFFDENNRFPTIKELCELTKFSENQIEELLQLQENVVSLETPIGEMQHGEQAILMDFIETDNDIEQEVFNANLREDIFKILEEFPERERQIILYRFGLEDGNPRTLEQIGQIYGVTRERIRQIEAKALRKLKHPSRARKLEAYYKK